MKAYKTPLLILIAIAGTWLIYPYAQNWQRKLSLEETYHKIRTLSDREVYDSYSTGERKSRISFEEIEKRLSNHRKPTNTDYKILEVVTNGEGGHVRVENQYCFSQKCDSSGWKTIIAKDLFLHKNGQWFIDDSRSACERTEPYPSPPEFERAVSLIVQRFRTSQRAEDQEFGRIFDSIKNCLEVKYAENDAALKGAEGVFLFSDDSPTDRLTIFVSPRYKYRDDLTTSLLLVHELYHASIRSNNEDVFYSCMDNEAYAHTIAYSYFFMLNQDEQDSLLLRYRNNPTDEVYNYFATNEQILGLPGNDLGKKFKDYVLSNKYYQQQCAGD